MSTQLDEFDHFPSNLLARMPEPFELWARHPRLGLTVVFVSTLEVAPDVHATPTTLVFTADELAAMGLGVATDRFQREDFDRLCGSKSHDGHARLTAAEAMNGAFALPDDPHASLGEILNKVGLVVEALVFTADRLEVAVPAAA